MSEEVPRPTDELVVDQEWDETSGGGPVKDFPGTPRRPTVDTYQMYVDRRDQHGGLLFSTG